MQSECGPPFLNSFGFIRASSGALESVLASDACVALPVIDFWEDIACQQGNYLNYYLDVSSMPSIVLQRINGELSKYQKWSNALSSWLNAV